MAKRSVLGLLYLLQGLQAAGENTQVITQNLALDAGQLDPSATIDLALEYALQRRIVDYIKHPAIGLYIGQQFNLAGYGPLLMLLMTSPDLLTALQLGVHYQKITFLFGKLGLTQQDDMILLTYDSCESEPAMHRFRADAEIAGTYKLLKDIQNALGIQTQLSRIDLPFAAPQDSAVIEQYKRFYDAPVYFDQPSGAIYCRTAILNHKILGADAVTHQRYKQQCDDALAQYLQDEQQASSITEQVRDYLRLQGNFMPSIAAVAQALGLSERTLRYRLAEQGSSFRALRDQLRFEKACELLKQNSFSIEQIAEQLHYNEASAFIHAFNRWCGMSPHQYRKRLADN